MASNIKGFSKWTKEEKLKWIATTYFSDATEVVPLIKTYWNSDEDLQKLHDEFIENTITNFYLPFGVAPNFVINDRNYTLPMVIEESSVVAAASKSAKFWLERGGFKASVLDVEKIGQVHFIYKGDFKKLARFIDSIQNQFFSDTELLTQNMRKRGGGILKIELRDKTLALENYYQLHVTFDTKDSMGANFINTCLEQIAATLKEQVLVYTEFNEVERELAVVMSILSNYVPNCCVRASVSCAVADLASSEIANPEEFVAKFIQAVRIAEVEPFRAVTHNKGIMNGVDALVLATGNDFRAVEAGVHAYAARNGSYSSLSHAKVEDGIFTFWLDLPLALGTVGGLTSLHPMVKIALKLLGNPNAEDLMKIVAVAGLAQNFAALKSLTTTGIQQGHMKMHLKNILNQFKATDDERKNAVLHFEKNIVSHAAVVELLESLRK
ncbi:hydroxymethylglutaryl-CoA reductase, degradative [Flavobacterium sp. NKUCC04_CG]|uniref:hydroxymethylglutaryl-CoA reductase, degradative n=1 Tax=Flavobacterium sp. NKUCC04_CG TaxID=2842121 RepID=UPI001C5BDA93|nr:hydroxymethylglutaryl-CoA reductase, degradative [Flavobacterium sp. NKUCC04_CG]MBW3519005.1 hydroxymethylglutaryl-CoA reductase, degradative [Flavobacterium sp. NKUCC04_CG]